MLDLYSVWIIFSEKYFNSALCLKHSIKQRVEVTFSDTEGGCGSLEQPKLLKHAYGSYFYFHHYNQGSSTALQLECCRT